jgi:hypothetical protein
VVAREHDYRVLIEAERLELREQALEAAGEEGDLAVVERAPGGRARLAGALVRMPDVRRLRVRIVEEEEEPRRAVALEEVERA